MSRQLAQRLAHAALRDGEPTAWFEQLYSSGATQDIPWADLEPNPNLVDWLNREKIAGDGRRAVKVGCGLGDDAEELARRGFAVTAFDISESAIATARRRFPGTRVHYCVADLFSVNAWQHLFDLVVESYTLQVLPPALRRRAIERVASLVARGGQLLVIARGRDEANPAGEMPWPLTRPELDSFAEAGLDVVRVEDYLDAESPPVRRFRAEYRKA